MNFKLIISLLFVAVSVVMVSCGDDDDKACSTNWAVELQAEINAFSTAAANYGQNPTSENCLAYKAAGLAYINKLEPYGNCSTLTGQQRTEWQANLDASRASLNDIVC